MLLKWTLFAIFGMLVFNYPAGAQYPGARLILTSKALDYGNVHVLIVLKDAHVYIYIYTCLYIAMYYS